MYNEPQSRGEASREERVWCPSCDKQSRGVKWAALDEASQGRGKVGKIRGKEREEKSNEL